MLVCDNKYIPAEDKDFFILLRIGLWQKVEEPLSAAPDWEYIYKLSCEQTVQGIVADGLGLYQETYPDCKVPDDVKDKFLQQTASIIQRNLRVNQLQSQICKVFNEEEITYVVMKGQAVAQYYPKPLLRVSGDIDFYLDGDNYERAKKILDRLSNNPGKESSDLRHYSSYFEDLAIELHSEEMSGIGKQKIFKLLKDEMLHNRDFRSYESNGVEVTLAPSAFDVTYIFLHFIKHYYTSGIGLRQICDWIVALSVSKTDETISQITDNLNRLQLNQQWQGLVQFAQIMLNKDLSSTSSIQLPQTLMPINLWDLCKQYGISKQSANSISLPHGHSKIQNYIRSIKNIHKQFLKQRSLSLGFAYRSMLITYWHIIQKHI